MQPAYSAISPRKVNRPETGHSKGRGGARRLVNSHLRRQQYTHGPEVKVETFSPGDYVDVTGRTKGKGFAGVMKRHGFHGLFASHGVERKHRSPGAIGGCATPGRVFKGTRMAGRMGGVRFTVQNLTVQAVDPENDLLLIKGALPGPRGSLVLVRSAVRKAVAA